VIGPHWNVMTLFLDYRNPHPGYRNQPPAACGAGRQL
jgi:hypothetical protein